MRHSFLIILLSLFTLTACDQGSTKTADGRETVEREGNPHYVRFDDHSIMDRAIAEAKANLASFEKALRQNPDLQDVSIKKGYEYGVDGNIEFIWIDQIKLVDGGFEGKIANEPVDATFLSYGETVTVPRDEVADWMYFENGQLQGGYTVAAMVYGTPEEKPYGKSMGIDYSRYEFLKEE